MLSLKVIINWDVLRFIFVPFLLTMIFAVLIILLTSFLVYKEIKKGRCKDVKKI